MFATFARSSESGSLSTVQAAFRTRRFAASNFDQEPAVGCWTAWWVPMGSSNTSRSIAYSTDRSRAFRPVPTASAAPSSRSGLTASNSYRPIPSVLTTSSSSAR